MYRDYEEDFFKRAEAYKTDSSNGAFLKTMTLCYVAPCMADEKKIRLIGYFDRDIGEMLPYINAVIKGASYNKGASTLTYGKERRLINLYNIKVTALQIYGWLPKTNCKACGEATCLAFAVRLLLGEQKISKCVPLSKESRFLENKIIMQEMAEALGVA